MKSPLKFCSLFVLIVVSFSVMLFEVPTITAKNRVVVFDQLNKEEPDEYPIVDLAKLQKSIVYPAIAKSNGIEGMVYVRAFVSKKGKVLKTVVDKTDSNMLTPSAVSAIKKTRFTPATKNGKTVNCWVSVPISFKL